MKQFLTLFSKLLIGCLSVFSVAQAQIARPSAMPARMNNQPVGDKSLQFIQNKNQWPASVRFAADLPDGRLFLQDASFIYTFLDGSQLPNHHSDRPVPVRTAALPMKVKGHAYKVTFLNATKNTVKVSGADLRPGLRNYYLGNDPRKWASGVKSYGEVKYQNLYNGVAMRLYQKEAHLKYEFLLQPNTNPNQIKLHYDGAAVALLANGDLRITTSVTTVIERKPVAFQTINGQLREVPCRFKLTGKVLSFDFPAGYAPNVPLLIDPELIFSSFSGSIADNWGFTATYDNEGNMYSGGATTAVGFPATIGAYDIDWNGSADVDLGVNGGWDIAILKYNPTASGPASLVYATYLGGSRADLPSSLVVNSKNELMVLGTTSSGDYPVTDGAVNPNFKGDLTTVNGNRVATYPLPGIGFGLGSDLIISRLSPDGSALLASTFMGGSRNEGLLDQESPLTHNYGDQFRSDIITDAADNVYVVSSTASSDFPVKNGFQSQAGGGESDAVIFKLNANLSNLEWSSYLGGPGTDAGYSIQLDAATNSVFICGGTNSPTLPGVAGAYRPVYLGGAADGFVAKISNDGQTLQRVSYLGTSSFDQAYFVQLDGTGNVYLLGQTRGNYPVTRGVYSVANGRQFIQKLNNNLTASIFSTVFGSNDNPVVTNISPTAFLVDDCNRIYVCGWGGDVNTRPPYSNGTTNGLPVTANAHQATTDGQDFYLMLLSSDASALEYATFFGGTGNRGEHVDGGTSRFDKRGFVYQAVCGGCGATSLFPTTPNAWSSTNRSENCNNAAFKFDFNIVTARAGDNESVCATAEPIQLTGFSPAGGIWSGPGVTPDGVFTPSPDLIGVQIINYTVANGSCVSTGTKTITVEGGPEVTFTTLPPSICLPNGPIPLTGSLPGGIFSGPGIVGNVFDPTVAGVGTHTIIYTLPNATGCNSISKQQVVVNQTPAVVAGPDERFCSGSSPIQLTGFSPAGGTWSGTGVSPSGLFTPTADMTGTYTLTYTVVNNNCSASATKMITINSAIQFVQSPDMVVCADAAPFRITDAVPPGGTWSGNGVTPDGLFTPGPQVVGTNVLTYSVTLGECRGSSTKIITVDPLPKIAASAEPTECGSATELRGYAPFTAKFLNATTGATGYLWDFGDGTTSTEAVPSHEYTQDGNFEVKLTVFFGGNCEMTSLITRVITDKKQLIPNVFTPNGDGKNDTFVPGVTCLPTDLKVFNRWGQLVYNQKNYQNTWDGKDLPEGIYFYHLTNSKGNNWKGWVEIVR
ncbi:gliding motility-associated C-terminal domain-containing protein [Adhaeribacter swui]|uniref:Gliding motility-associated C-terminal domain-containing protein n=1 Tax=Adhaeribacter swui TaxID=2086471 RepID=A0A7G7G6I7_9BACT|nr:gliding motility-associated C-terminal domain-containing protein [Adhaeribacter swui]QNF32771.1 gliding motility-associated C-terminal domain-containing protein [Adhaeribacter swui]